MTQVLENGLVKAGYVFGATNRMAEAVTEGRGRAEYVYNCFLDEDVPIPAVHYYRIGIAYKWAECINRFSNTPECDRIEEEYGNKVQYILWGLIVQSAPICGAKGEK